MRWRTKTRIQKWVEKLPVDLSYRVYHRIQHFRGLKPDVGEQVRFIARLEQYLARSGRQVAGGSFVELGSGWFALTPLLLMAKGARAVATFDIAEHYAPDRIRQAAAALRQAVPALSGSSVLRQAEASGELPAGVTYCHRVGLQDYPDLAPASVDFAYSNAVLAYIPPPVLRLIHERSRAWMAPDARWFHLVSAADMRAYQDKSLHLVDFIRYSDEEWDRIGNNRFSYHNRLRRPEYRDLFAATGWSIEDEDAEIRPEALAGLASVPRSERFQRFTPEDLVAGRLWFVLKQS